MSDQQAIVKVRMGSERNFGLVIGSVFALIALWPLLHGNGLRVVWMVFAFAFVGAALVVPGVLTRPNRAWFKLGLLLGAVIAPIVMALVYLVVFLPIGVILRLRQTDLLQLNERPDATSYWIERRTRPQSMTRQF